MNRILLLILSIGISLAAFAGPITLLVDKTTITEGDSVTCTITRPDTIGAISVKYSVGPPKVNITAVNASSSSGITTKNVFDGKLDTYWMNAGNSDIPRYGKDDSPSITFTFDQIYKLESLRVANFAVPGHSFRGMKDVMIEGSTDGQIFTLIGNRKFAKGPDAKDSVFEDIQLNGTSAKFIRFVVRTNYGGKEFGNGTSREIEAPNPSFVGLNEVEFYTDGINKDDINPLPGVIVIPDGQLSASFQLETIDDNKIEKLESMQIRLLPEDNLEPSSATVKISDNDTGDEVSIIATTPTAFEAGNKPGVFTFKRKGTNGDLKVSYSTCIIPLPIIAVNASDSRFTATAEKTIDGDLGTYWTNNGNAIHVTSEEIDNPWIIFTFDKVYSIGQLRVANCIGTTFWGLKDVDFMTTTEMMNFASQGIYTFKRSAEKVTVSEFETFDLGGINARRVLFSIKSNYDRVFGNNTSLEKTYPWKSIVGLSEVAFFTGGTASKNDYLETLTGTVTIPDGKNSVTLSITPIDDKSAEDDETVIVTLIPDFITYTVSDQSAATVTIKDEELPL